MIRNLQIQVDIPNGGSYSDVIAIQKLQDWLQETLRHKYEWRRKLRDNELLGKMEEPTRKMLIQHQEEDIERLLKSIETIKIAL